MANETPTLSVIDGGAADEQPAEEPQAAPPATQPQPITVASQARTYAILAAQLKRETHLGDGAVTKIIELALHERFTLLQMGLARPSGTPIEAADGSEDPS